ncbi:efflux RND transporter periplasmic adaptor subunit [bacterium]|nr:efflux RND transporter periplasmic adaptor subunit [bacterium]
MRKRTKRTIIIVGVIFLAFLVWRIILLITGSNESSNRRFGKPPVAVEVDKATYGQIQETRKLTGTIFPLYQYIIAPKVSGRIINISKRIGDWVEEGEVIARIDDAEYRQAVLEAQANLKISEANVAEVEIQFELARQELERVQSLQEKGIASPSELDAATTNFNALESRIKLANAQVEQRQAALNSARIRQNYTNLIAPKPGFVGERYVDEGSLLAPNASVVLILGIDTVIVRTTVVERVYGQIKVDQPAEILVDAFPEKTFTGRVSRIAPMVQEASRVAQMEIEVVNDSLMLKPGMFCSVNLVLSEKDNTQVVPSQAVVDKEGASGLFVIDEKEPIAHYIPVSVGIVTPEKTEILSPKIKGMVVTLGQHLLEEGSNVILPDEKAEDRK